MKTETVRTCFRAPFTVVSRFICCVAAPFTGASEERVSWTRLAGAQAEACGYRSPMLGRLRCCTRSVTITALLLLSGCLYEHVVWSPDGNHAAVISGDNLFLSDSTGKLTSALVSNVGAVAWFGDSERLVLWRTREVRDWATVSNALGQARAEAVTAQAEAIWRQFQAGSPWSVASMNLGDKADLVKVCLRERHGTELKIKLDSGEWKDLESKKVDLSDVVLARLEGDSVRIGATLHEDLGKIWDLRPSPQGTFIAFTAEMKPEADDLRLVVVPSDGSTGAVVVASHTAAYPDWSTDGRSLVYVEASDPTGDKKDVGSLGVLSRRTVLDAEGRIKLEEKPQYLAGGMFNGLTRVRCLRDGRILFNAAEIALPISAADYGGQREQLFALDPARQATLVRLIPRQHESDLPEALVYFEVSPDEQQVLFGGDKMQVCLLTVSNGQVNVVQPAGSNNDMQGLPVWRKAGEFTYMKRIEPSESNAAPRKVEIVLRRGDEETVLSKTWPDDVVEHLVK